MVRHAIVVDRYGPIDHLAFRDLPVPPLASDQALVRVCAAAISPGDRALITGIPYVNRLAGNGVRHPRQPIPGFDVAGVVEDVGSDVDRFRPGDQVFGNAHGALTDLAVADAGRLAPLPDGWTFAGASAVPESGCVALQVVRGRATIGPNVEVAVLGAGGGVGTYVTQLAVALGARVTAVCGTAKVRGVDALGVDRTIDYHEHELRDDGRRFDVVIDTAGTTPLRRILPAMTPTGTLVLVGADHRRRVTGGLGRWLGAIVLSVVSRRRLRPLLARPLDGAMLDDLVEAMTRGEIRPAVDRTFGLDETVQAFEYLDHRTGPGKVVVVVHPDLRSDAPTASSGNPAR